MAGRDEAKEELIVTPAKIARRQVSGEERARGRIVRTKDEGESRSSVRVRLACVLACVRACVCREGQAKAKTLARECEVTAEWSE
jgi:hypothetical protein